MAYKLRPKAGTGIWVVDFEDGETGARRRVSTGTRDKGEATRRARDIVLGLEPGQSAPKPATSRKTAGPTVGELFDRCERTVWHPREARSQATITSNLRILRALDIREDRFEHLPAAEVTYSVLEEAKDVLFARGYAPASVKRKLDMVSKALTMATKWSGPDGRPILTGKPAMPTITTDNARERVLSEREEAAVFRAIDARRRKEPTRDWRRFGALVRFLLDTGCRLGEALGALDEHVEAREAATFVTFPRYTTKNKKPRTLPLTSAVVADLDYLRAAAIDGRLFPLRPATAWYMWDGIRADLQALGFDLSDVVLHSMRHTCGTRLAKRLPIHKVSLWLGHSSVKVTMDHYAHLQADDFMDAHAVLEAA